MQILCSELKKKLFVPPGLMYSTFQKPFLVEIDASYRTLGKGKAKHCIICNSHFKLCREEILCL